MSTVYPGVHPVNCSIFYFNGVAIEIKLCFITSSTIFLAAVFTFAARLVPLLLLCAEGDSPTGLTGLTGRLIASSLLSGSSLCCRSILLVDLISTFSMIIPVLLLRLGWLLGLEMAVGDTVTPMLL